jgi:dipeptidyl aminopeptidase/acylaminoacyl peptidase
MNWGGTQVAYLLKSPNVDQNRNDYQLYVREIGDKSLSAGKLLVTGAEISNLTWLRDDSGVAMLMSIGGSKKLVFVNIAAGSVESTVEASRNIEDYSVDATGSTVVYSVANPPKERDDAPGASQEEIAKGYRISVDDKPADAWEMWKTSTIYTRRREPSGGWSQPRELSIENPFTHIAATRLYFVAALSLSPNGKRLLFTYLSDTVPEEWKSDPLVKRHPYTATSLFQIMVLYDMDKATTTIAFKSISPASVPLWAGDSGSFLVNAWSPIGSHWEAEDIEDHRGSVADGNLFVVNVDTGEVEEVFRNVPDHHEGPLFWKNDGDVIIRSASNTIARIHRFKDSWREVEDVRVTQREDDRFLYLVSNGKEIVGTHESLSTPRNLFIYEPGESQFRLLSDLNPQLRNLKFAPVTKVNWKSSEGLNATGLLFMPPNYVSGFRYPLVINTKGNDGLFTCDSGYIDDPSFAPQPIATSGVMYLIRTQGEDWKFQEEIDSRPKGYPGGISEAVQLMDLWDSAVEALDKRGMVDPSKVGIIGFSRTGWHVEFDLVHSHLRYAAATAADNVQYSLSDYWLSPGFSTEVEQMYGGPPSGKTLENWRKYSVSFNLDKIHTPLLMEVMGYGTRDDNEKVISVNLAVRFEIAKGLTRLGKPVEMYFYPNEVHQPEHPLARIASEQRNVDWYRFWLQGYERPNPEDPDQYKRWEHFRDLHAADLASDSSAEVGETRH